MPSLLTIYKDLHAHPELSGQEEKTAAFVAKELRAVGCEVTEKVGKYDKPQHRPFGVVGVMKNGAGPTVLVRTDLDGLPVKEETGLPYASKDKAKNEKGEEVGVMHACGHDMHISAFIGTARALAKLKRPVERHDYLCRPAGRRDRRRRSRDVKGRPLHPLAETGFRPRLA